MQQKDKNSKKAATRTSILTTPTTLQLPAFAIFFTYRHEDTGDESLVQVWQRPNGPTQINLSLAAHKKLLEVLLNELL